MIFSEIKIFLVNNLYTDVQFFDKSKVLIFWKQRLQNFTPNKFFQTLQVISSIPRQI